MRVITGSARGTRLETLSGNDVRPTTDMVKEAVFSIIQFDIDGSRVLDLFGGSGQMGIEALSRGAQNAVFVDSSADSVGVITRNLAATRLERNAKVVKSDFSLFLSSALGPFDIAFLDPPYQLGLLPRALTLLTPKMSGTGLIICEHPTDVSLPENVGGFCIRKSYRYGKIAITVYHSKED